MRRFLLCTALLMAILPAAANADDKWEGNFRRCQIEKVLPEGQRLAEVTTDDLPNLQKWIAFLKMCDRFWRCVAERDGYIEARGKRPKHCYQRDRDIPVW
jgi:hypothetical protein